MAVEKRKDGDDAATIDEERRPIERHERIDHLIDLLREKPKERVLPPYALEISVLDPHDQLARPKDRAACAADDSLKTGRTNHPVPINDSFPDEFEF